MPWMEPDGETYVLPESHRNKMPLQFSVSATKPMAG